MMKDDQVDYTILFGRLCGFYITNLSNNNTIRGPFLQREFFGQWAKRYQQRLSKEALPDTERRQT